MNKGSSFHLDSTSPEKSPLGDSRLSELNFSLPFKSLRSDNDLGLLDRHIDSSLECDPDDLGEIPLSNQIIPSGLETLVNTREVTGNISWTSSMATPLSKNVTYSNLNTEERQVFLPSDDCASAVKRRALFTPDITNSPILLNGESETPKVQRATKLNVGRTLLAFHEESSLRSNADSSFCSPEKNESEKAEQSIKRKSFDSVSPIVSKKRLKMQKNRVRNKVVGSPEPKADEILQNRTATSVDMFNDSAEDIFSEFDNASSTPSRSTSEKTESPASTSRASSAEKNSKSSSSLNLDNTKNESLDLDKTLTETTPKKGWSPDDSFNEDMVKAFNAFEVPAVSDLKSRVQTIKEASLNPSVLYVKTAVPVSKSSATAEDILKSMSLQGKYNDSQPAKPSCLTRSVQPILVPFSQLDTATVAGKSCDVPVELPLVNREKNRSVDKSERKIGGCDKNVTPPGETSILTDQQLIQAGEEAEMLLLLEHEEDWLQSKLDHCKDNDSKPSASTDFIKPDDGFRTAGGKDVFISQKALNTASKLLADLEEDEPTSVPDVSFSFASGKKVFVSQEALEKANNLLADLEDDFELSTSSKTAKGSKISVSQEALDKASLPLDEEDCQPKKRKFVELEEESERVGFATASGKTVEVSEEALERAKRLLEDEDGAVVSKKMKAETSVTLDDLCMELANMEDSGSANAGGAVSDGVYRKATAFDKSADRKVTCDRKPSSEKVEVSAEEGFATASGKKVTISSSALEKAKKFFSDEDSTVEDILAETEKLKSVVASSQGKQLKTESVCQTPTEGGFATASGKKVAISSSALEKAKKFFDDGNTAVEDILAETEKLKSSIISSQSRKVRAQSTSPSTDGGFATASGKTVTISNSALEKAKKFFTDENSTVEDIIAETEKLKSSVASSQNRDKVKSTATSTEGGFATASGKKVTISNSALEKAKKFFDDEDSTVEDILAETEKLKSSVASSQIKKLETESTSPTSTEGGFATASGKKVTISDSALEKAKKFFDDENTAVEDIVAETEKLKSSLLSSQSRKVTVQSAGPTSTDGGFATASGKRVTISNSALEKAKKFFTDEDSTVEDIIAETEKLKSSVASSQSRKLVETSSTFTEGFATASGKKVTISSSALEKAKKFFNDEDSTVEDIIAETLKLKSSVSSSQSRKLNAELTDSTCTEGAFATASGKKVAISSSALEIAKNLFADEDLSEEDFSKIVAEWKTRKSAATASKSEISPKSEFSTSRYKNGTIKNSAIEKAQQLLEDENADSEDLPKYEKPATVVGKHEKACSLDTNGFATASGKEVTISNSALEKAKKLFGDENADMVDLSDLARSIRNRRIGGEGTKTEISSSTKIKTVLKEVLNNTSTEDCFKLSSLPLEDDLTKVGFATASGKSVPVSEEAIQKARLLFQEDEDVALKDPTSGSDVPAVKTSSLSHTGDGLNKRELLKRVENDGFKVPFAVRKRSPIKVVPEKEFDGFSTASGHNVPVSQKALSRARAIFEEIDQDDVQGGSVKADSSDLDYCKSEKIDTSKELKFTSGKPISPIKPVVTESPPVSQELGSENQSLNLSESQSKTINQSLSQEIMESTAAFLADESENSFTFPAVAKPISPIKSVMSLDKPKTSLEPVMSEPLCVDDRINAPEAVTVFQEDCSPIVAPGSPILGEKSVVSRRKIRRKVGGRLSLSTSLAGKCSTPIMKKENNANISLPVNLNVESPATVRSEEDQRKVWENEEDDETLANLEIDDVISGVTGMKAEEESVAGRELRPEVSEARKRAAEEQEKVVKGGIAGKKGPKMAKGSLFAAKSSSANLHRPLKLFVGSETPGPGNREELRRLGIGSWVCNVTSENAVNFRFNAWNFYSADVCLENVFGLPVGDGARLILNDEGSVGVAEIERAFLASESVDPALVPSGWVPNHYRWIVWKLASLERRFPKYFARVLSPHIVMLQLKYRYDREIDRCERSALRRILEHDDSAARRMVTCVASIKKVEGEAGIPQIELELTDGWYSVFAVIDKELQNRVLKGRVAPGTKLITHGAELVNCPQGCPPLEISSDVRLKITSNSSRRACWSAKLGFQRDPRPFRIPLESVLANGGMVGCIKVYIARIYPLIYLEKKDKARTVVRSERAERREAAQAEIRRQKAAEEFYVQMQNEVQHNQSNPTKTKRHVTRQLVARANTTQELCALMESAIDPAAFESMLSDEQKKMVLDLQREKQESLCREVQSKVKQRLEDKSIPQRNVTPVLKIRLVDGKNPDSECSASLSIWHPPEEMSALFKETQLTTMYSLTVNGWRGGVLQLSATRSTQYHQTTEREVTLPPSMIRTLTPLSDLYSRKFSPSFGEVDVVGVVVRVDPPPQPASNNNETPGRTGSLYQSVYLADQEENVISVSFWGGLREFGVDDMLNVGVVISMANLQWRGGSLKGPICLYAQEVSVFSVNPRQQKLRDAIQTLQKITKPDVTSFVKSCVEKLEELLKNATPYKMHSSSPNEDIRLQGGESPILSASTPKQIHKKLSSTLAEVRTSIPVQHSPLASSLKEFSPGVQERLKKLDMYGDAPPLPPIVMAQRRSSLRRGFRPPRRTLDTSSIAKVSSSDDKTS